MNSVLVLTRTPGTFESRIIYDWECVIQWIRNWTYYLALPWMCWTTRAFPFCVSSSLQWWYIKVKNYFLTSVLQINQYSPIILAAADDASLSIIPAPCTTKCPPNQIHQCHQVIGAIYESGTWIHKDHSQCLLLKVHNKLFASKYNNGWQTSCVKSWKSGPWPKESIALIV